MNAWSRWLAAFVSGGQKALTAKPIPGRPPLLSHEQIVWVVKAVRDNTPQQLLRFEFGLWTIKLIRHLIEREFGVKFSSARSSAGGCFDLLC